MTDLILHNDINEVPLLGEWVEQLGEELGLDMSAVFQLNLALEEAVVNVMNYAYPGKTGMPINLTVCVDKPLVTFTLSDEGVPFDPTAKEEPDLTLGAEDRPIGGLGIFLVNQIMKDVVYQRDSNKNVLKMVYHIL